MLTQPPTRLTIDGIKQLVSKSSFPGQSFVLQVLGITSNYLGHHYCELSDGYCKMQCQLVGEAKSIAETQKLIDNGIVRFGIGQCEVIAESSNPYIVLSNCEVVKQQLGKTIGAPMPYKLYKEKGYQNPEASNLIDQGPKTYTIRQIINNTRIKNGHIKATVTKLPNNASRGLFIFNMRDSEGTEIQGVCFQQAVDLFLKELRLNEQYLFSGFVLQKNKKTNGDQLKFKKEGEISRVVKTDKGQVYEKVNQNHNTNVFSSNATGTGTSQPFRVQLQSTSQTQQDEILTKQRLMQLIRQDKIQGKFFTIVGKVTYVNLKPMFRKINVQDKKNDIIDLILWEQVKDTVLMEKVYKFTNLRVKHKPDMKESKYIELQSSKNTTVSAVDQVDFQLMSIQSRPYERRQYKNGPGSHVEEKYREERTKKLPQGSKVISIEQLIQLSQAQPTQQTSIQQLYPICQCTIKFRTEGLRFKDQGDTLSYFNFFCKPCGKAGSVSLGDNEIVFCNRCKRDDIQIKWNLRVRVMDFKNELPCSLQSQTTERFLNIAPKQGYLMYMQSKEQFEKLLHRVNFDNRVCKFQIKTQGVNKYFNILEIYAKDTQNIIIKHLADLRKSVGEFEKDHIIDENDQIDVK